MATQLKVRCTTDEPLQKLMEKLSSKSPDLYIFWQNYNQLYSVYSERLADIEILRIEVDKLKAQNERLRIDVQRQTAVPIQYPPQPPQPVIIQRNNGPSDIEINSLKEKIWSLERTAAELKNDCDNWRQQVDSISSINERLVQENRNYQVLLKQFKTQNSVQKQNIDHILNRLKEAEIDLQGSRTSRGNTTELNEALTKSRQNQDSLRKALADKDSEIQLIMVSIEEMRMSYERLLSESIRNIKNKMAQSIPSLIEQARTVRHLKPYENVMTK